MRTSPMQLLHLLVANQITNEGVNETLRGLDEGGDAMLPIATLIRVIVAVTQSAVRASNPTTPNAVTGVSVTTDDGTQSTTVGGVTLSRDDVVGMFNLAETFMREMQGGLDKSVDDGTNVTGALCDAKEELALMRLLLQEIHLAGRVTDRAANCMASIFAEIESWEPVALGDTNDMPSFDHTRRLTNALLQRKHLAVSNGQLATTASAVGVAVSATSTNGLDVVLPSQWQHDFMLRALQSDALMRQMSPAKRAAAQLLDLYGHQPATDRDQFELFKKAFASMGAAAAMGVVRRHFGEGADPVLEEAVAKLVEMEGHFPEMGAHSASKAAEEALCLMHLENACRRVGVRPLTRVGFSALYLGEFNEVRLRFAGYVTVRRDQVTTFLRDEQAGKAFWCALCTRAGLPVAPYDANIFQIEHVLNTAWGGADHYLNFMVLHRVLNNAAEFRYGPGEVKMILLGAHKFGFVQRFARWDRATDATIPRDIFLKIESEHYALPALSLHGRQLQLRESYAKRIKA